MQKRSSLLFLIIPFLLFTVVFMNGTVSASEENEFVYAAGTEPTTLDPQFVTDVNTARAVMQIHETLVTWDENSKIAPLLATSWSVSEDKKTWTFKLREGVTFQDGAPFNAEAVKYNLDRILDPEVSSPRASVASMITNVEVLGEYEVAITTDEPFGPMLAQLTSYNLAMISPKAGKEYGKDYGRHPAGTSPVMLDTWVPGREMVMKRYDGYWGEQTPLEKLTFKVIPEDAARVMMLKTGAADVIAGVPPVMVQQVEADPNVEVVVKTGYRTIYIGMNNQKGPFKDVKVRQAINYAINKKNIIQYLLRGLGTYPVGVESPVIYNAAQELTPSYAYNPEKAKKLLTEAGYPEGFKTVLHSPEGRYPMDKQVAEVVQGQLKEVGIDAEIRVLDWGAYQDVINKGEDSRLFLLGKGSPTGDLDLTLSLSMVTNARMNNAFYSNPEVDELIAAQRVTVDEEERRGILLEAQQIIHEEAAWAVLYYEKQTVGKRANVDGLIVWPNEMLDLRYLERK